MVGQVERGRRGEVAQTQGWCVRHGIGCCIVIPPRQRVTVPLNQRQLRCDWLAGLGGAAASPLGLEIGAPAEVLAGVAGVRVVAEGIVMVEVQPENGGIRVLGVAVETPVGDA